MSGRIRVERDRSGSGDVVRVIAVAAHEGKDVLIYAHAFHTDGPLCPDAKAVLDAVAVWTGGYANPEPPVAIRRGQVWEATTKDWHKGRRVKVVAIAGDGRIGAEAIDGRRTRRAWSAPDSFRRRFRLVQDVA